MSKATDGAELLREIIETMRFIECPCGNEQPYILGRGIPDCEECGHKFQHSTKHRACKSFGKGTK